jgi:hypothetical protein
MKRYFLIEKAILEIIDRLGQAEWTQIMSEVSGAVLVADWLEVRNVIQNLKNQSIVYRAPLVSKEIYLRVGNEWPYRKVHHG